MYVSGGEKGAFGLKTTEDVWKDAGTGEGRELLALLGDPPLLRGIAAKEEEEGSPALAAPDAGAALLPPASLLSGGRGGERT